MLESLRRSRRGFALPVAIGAIVLVGMMLAGVFFAVTQDARVGRNTQTQEVAFRAAETGLNAVYANWSAGGYNNMPVGSTTVSRNPGPLDSSASKGWTDTVKVTKLYLNAFVITSTGYAGTANRDNARRRTAMLVKLTWPKFNFLGALTVRGAIQIGGSSNINGNDMAPTGWACPPLDTTLPAVATNNSSNVTFSGCTNMSCLSGHPQVQVTAAANDSTTYFSYGDATWNSLVQAATLTIAGGQTFSSIAPVISGSTCVTSNVTNWGDVNRNSVTPGACESYFPIIHITDTTANTIITGGSGQGILLVEGDLTVNGGFAFYGPVIVRGHLRTQGTGGHFYGGVMAANVDLEQNAVLGNAIINYSKCAVQAAILGSGAARPANDRPWAESF